jgi:dTDP-glucose 4,6-dehydratase
MDWLKSSNEPVVNLDLLTYAGNLSSLESLVGNDRHHFVQGDIADPSLVPDLLSRFKPRAVVHFAAESHVDRSIHGPETFINTNVLGTFNLLQATRAYLESVSPSEREGFRFLHVSTDEVYGSLSAHAPAFTEDHAYEPNSPYSASKAASDHLVRAWHHTFGLPTLTTNCSNNYGPYQFPEKLIPLMIHNATQGRSLPVYGDGKNVRDWLYVGDHCAAIRCVLQSGKLGETYNIGGNAERQNIEVVHVICDLLDELSPRSDGGSYRSQIEYVTDRPGHDRRYAIDARKISGQLGWQPSESFESGMRKTVEWYLTRRDWVEGVTSGQYRQWTDLNYGQRSSHQEGNAV